MLATVVKTVRNSLGGVHYTFVQDDIMEREDLRGFMKDLQKGIDKLDAEIDEIDKELTKWDEFITTECGDDDAAKDQANTDKETYMKDVARYAGTVNDAKTLKEELEGKKIRYRE